jgi:tetratricopeptide (TPR) repeat protein
MPLEAAAHRDRLLKALEQAIPGPNDEYTLSAMLIPVIARITGETDSLDLAQETAQAVITSPHATPFMVGWATAGLPFLAVQKGDSDAAREHYPVLESQRNALLIIFNVTADRILGLLSHTMGELDQAVDHFEAAMAFCNRASYRSELAWTCCDYSDMLRERDGEGDLAKAVSLLDESLAISSELGMRPLMERVLSRREISKA